MKTHASSPARLAAIVYDEGVAVDALMLTFARELRDRGVMIGGIVQMPPDGPGCGPEAPMRLQDVGTGDVIPICQNLGPGAQGCRLDTATLAEAAERLGVAAQGAPALLFVAKFGKQEVNGQGFRAEMARAAREGRTMLTAVKRGMVHNWLEFTGGIGTLLDHRLWVLEDWWRSVKP